MPIRIACPRCSAALTVSERGVGHVVTCPKCRGKMVIPAATVPATKEDVEEPPPNILDFSEPAPPPRRPSPAAMPKRIVERAVVEDEDEDDDDDDDEPRPRRRRKRTNARTRPRSPGPIIVLAVGIVLTIAAGAGAFWLAMRAAGNMNPVARRGADAANGTPETTVNPAEPNDQVAGPDTPNELTPPPPEEKQSDEPLPAGWSYNSPSLGFKAAWPVEKGTDGFAPTASIYAGTSGAFGGSAWGVGLGRAEASHLGVSSMVLPDVAIEPEQTLDNYMAKITRRMPSATVKRVTVWGRTGREITFVENGRTVVHRATIVKNVIWTAQAVYSASHADSAKRFLDSFRAL